MKYILHTILFLLVSSLLYSQNWSIYNSGEAYHYKKDPSISVSWEIIYSIHADSLSVDGNDTIFYMPRTFVKCDTCNQYIERSYFHDRLYTESFMYGLFKDQIIKKQNGEYIFKSYDDSVLIKTLSKPGDSWFADEGNTLHQISCTDIQVENIFNEPDSVKTLVFQESGAIIKLSKNHGIVEFPHNISDTDTTYTLEGIQSKNSGVNIPDFWDIYNFDSGDIFQYYYSGYDMDDESSYSNIYKKIIVHKKVSGDTLYYGDSTNQFEEATIYINDPNHPVNRYTGYIWQYDYSGLPSGFDKPEIYFKTWVLEDERGVFKLVGRSMDLWEAGLYGIYEPTEHSEIYYSPDEGEIIQYQEYREYLGQTVDSWTIFEHSQYVNLMAAKTSNVSFQEEKLIDGLEAPHLRETSGFEIKYLPSDNMIKIISGEKEGITSFGIINLDGKIMKQINVNFYSSYLLDISDLKTGIYIISIENDNITETYKLPVLR